MNRPLLSPIGPFESLWQTTLNPPANHSHVSVQVVLPPGPHGPGFISPEPFHLPINTPRRFCSAPGFGGPAGACACAATALMNKVTSNPTKIRFAIFILAQNYTRAAPLGSTSKGFPFDIGDIIQTFSGDMLEKRLTQTRPGVID